MSSFISYAQTQTAPPTPPANVTPQINALKPNSKHIISGDDPMTGKHEHAKARVAKLRAKTQKRKAELAERRALRKAELAQSRSAQKAKADREREALLKFKNALLEMLIDDAIINPDRYVVEVAYAGDDIMVNDVNLSKQHSGRYNALWQSYGRVISQASYMRITPQLYEIREITDAGGNYHFKMQTG